MNARVPRAFKCATGNRPPWCGQIRDMRNWGASSRRSGTPATRSEDAPRHLGPTVADNGPREWAATRPRQIREARFEQRGTLPAWRCGHLRGGGTDRSGQRSRNASSRGTRRQKYPNTALAQGGADETHSAHHRTQYCTGRERSGMPAKVSDPSTRWPEAALHARFTTPAGERLPSGRASARAGLDHVPGWC